MSDKPIFTRINYIFNSNFFLPIDIILLGSLFYFLGDIVNPLLPSAHKSARIAKI